MTIRSSFAVGLTLLAVSPLPADAAGYAQTVTVAKLGGDFDNPATALQSITDASANKPYLVKIYPGVYDIGAGFMRGSPFVDIEGSGEGVTVVQNFGPVLRVAANEEVRALTLRSYWSGTSSCVVDFTGAGTLRHVKVDATPNSRACGILTQFGGLFDHVTVTAYGTAVAIDEATLPTTTVFDHCELSANEAVYISGTGHTVTFNESSTSGFQHGFLVGAAGNLITITRSRLLTTAYAIDAPSGVLVLDSIVDGDTRGGVKCVGTVNSALDPVTCPTYSY